MGHLGTLATSLQGPAISPAGVLAISPADRAVPCSLHSRPTGLAGSLSRDTSQLHALLPGPLVRASLCDSPRLRLCKQDTALTLSSKPQSFVLRGQTQPATQRVTRGDDNISSSTDSLNLLNAWTTHSLVHVLLREPTWDML